MSPKVPAVSTISDKIYDYLKNAIVTNKIPPNQRINEKEIAAMFDSSATPVREAVLRLYAEGFVSIERYRHVIVKDMSAERYQDLCDFMRILDYNALKTAIKNLSDSDFKVLNDHLSAMQKHMETDSLEKFFDHSVMIHEKIWGKVENEVYFETLVQIYQRIRRYNYIRLSLFMSTDFLKTSFAKHKKLIETLKSGKAAGLQKLVEEHWTYQ